MDVLGKYVRIYKKEKKNYAKKTEKKHTIDCYQFSDIVIRNVYDIL